MLDVDREDAIRILNSGENIMLSGNAGAGKTYLIKEFAANSKKRVALTATTGIAALNLGGETVHRLLGLGITTRPEHADLVLRKWKAIKGSSKPWDKAKWKMIQAIDSIVIDEASMLRSDQLDLINVVLSSIRNSPKAFGGVQIVLVGDFFQLPPVVTTADEGRYEDLANPFCFQSDSWRYGKFYAINLTTNYRQSSGQFLDILNKIRYGQVDDEVDQIMSSRLNAKIEGNIKPLKLFAHKIDVNTANMNSLKEINEPKFRSMAEYVGKKIDVEILQKDCPADHKLYFCKGAQIMMITNDQSDRWVNGSMGIITSIDPLLIQLSDGSIIAPELFKWERINYQFNNGKWEAKVVASMTQYPFKLSYSSSIHKSQGLTLDAVEIDIEKCFAAGQAYVALSRVKSLEGLSLKSWNRDAVRADERVINFYRKKK